MLRSASRPHQLSAGRADSSRPPRRIFFPAVFMTLAAAAAVFFSPASCFAADSAEGIAGIFSAGAARLPEPGEWLEYRIAFPADPLENALRPDPAPPPPAGSGKPEGIIVLNEETYIVRPEFEPVTAWRSLPLRLEITVREEDGLAARMSFEGGVHTVSLPLTRPSGTPGFDYTVSPPAGRAVQDIGGVRYEVTVTRRHEGQYGFVRHESEEVPFGLARFASEHLDFILVGMGTGTPPAFPLELPQQPDPPPGMLYTREQAP